MGACLGLGEHPLNAALQQKIALTLLFVMGSNWVLE